MGQDGYIARRIPEPGQRHRHIGLAPAEGGHKLRGLQEALEARRGQAQHNLSESDDWFVHF